MAKKRMREKGDDELFAVHSMVREFSERLSNYESLPTLSEVLVELLNGKTLNVASKQRVMRIIQLLRFQSGYVSQLSTRLQPRDQVVADLYIDALLGCNSELNDALLNYKVIPQIHPIGTAPILYFLTAESNGHSPKENAEIGAVMCALQLAQQSQIENARECLCGTFFVAGRIDQNHCSVKCRVKAHQSSEEFKAKRREADRKRYRLHRDGKVKETNRRINGTKKTR
ncbi:MAG: hypothetical protein P4L87_09080 [Formivibrio sp.]|nr:hypothetical protein [Formivibrio sp.]